MPLVTLECGCRVQVPDGYQKGQHVPCRHDELSAEPEGDFERYLRQEESGHDGLLTAGGMSLGGIFGSGEAAVATDGYDPAARARAAAILGAESQAQLMALLAAQQKQLAEQGRMLLELSRGRSGSRLLAAAQRARVEDEDEEEEPPKKKARRKRT